MSDARIKRLTRELGDCAKDKQSGIIVRSVGDSLDKLQGSFPGPVGTSYEGGRFEVSIEPPTNYPFAPLKMKFITRVYHPNISSATGMICLDILKDAWSPVFTIKTAMISLQSLLSTPEASDPQDAEVAKHYLSDRKGFEETARYWTNIYAKNAAKPAAGEPTVDEALLAGIEAKHVTQFVSMGFPRDKVVEVLKLLNYRGSNTAKVSENEVIERLLR